MEYTELLGSEYIIDTYKKIDHIERDNPINHGFIHINNVVNNGKEIARLFGFTKREEEMLLSACVLHDIGYLLDRENHARNGAILALGYLKDNSDYNVDEIKRIAKSIASHGGVMKEDYLDKISLSLILADKMDFVKTRYDRYLCNYDRKYLPFLTIQAVKLTKEEQWYELVIDSTDRELEQNIIECDVFKRFNQIVDNINKYTEYKIRIRFLNRISVQIELNQ